MHWGTVCLKDAVTTWQATWHYTYVWMVDGAFRCVIRTTWLGIILISRYSNIDRQPHMAAISYDRLRLRYPANTTTRLILMDDISRQTDKPGTRPSASRVRRGQCRYVSNRLTVYMPAHSNRLRDEGKGVAERPTATTPAPRTLEIGYGVTAWLTGSLMLLLNHVWSHSVGAGLSELAVGTRWNVCAVCLYRL